MNKILNSIDCLITTIDNKIILIKRESEPEKNKLALIGGVQDDFESFESTTERILKQKLGILTKIKNNQITINNNFNFNFKQFKSYDSGKDKRGGNTTLFTIETTLSENELKQIIPKEVFFYDMNKLPKLAFEHNKFIQDYFFEKKNYTLANIQDIGITTDIVILTINEGLLKVLLAKRSKEPYKEHYTLPGGFINKEKSLRENAEEILKRDTNITGAFLEQLYTFGNIERDSRGRVITVSYFALINSSKVDLIFSKKYDEINWFNLSQINKMKIAFDHKKIIMTAIERIRNKIEYTNIAFQLLPEKFTLAELQEVYEIILEKSIDKRNFRKKINSMDMLIELNEFKKEGRMRPAKYHKFKNIHETILKAKSWV